MADEVKTEAAETTTSAEDNGFFGLDPNFSMTEDRPVMDVHQDKIDAAKKAKAEEKPATDAEPVPKEETPGTDLPADSLSVQHDPSVLALASDLGITADEAKAMQPLDLTRLMTHLARQALKLPRPQAESPKPAPVVEEFQPSAKLAAKKESLDEDVYDILESAERGSWEAKQHAKRIEQQVNAERQSRAQEQESKAVAEVDSAFDAAAATHGKLFGKGGITSLGADDPARDHRQTVVTRAIKLAGGRTPTAAHIQKAISLLYPVAAAKSDKTVNGANRIADLWKDGTLTAPLGRTTELPKGDVKARQTVAAKLREAGMADNLDENDDPYGLNDLN